MKKYEIYCVTPDETKVGLKEMFVVATSKDMAVDAYCNILRAEQEDLLFNAWKDGLVEIECFGNIMEIGSTLSPHRAG